MPRFYETTLSITNLHNLSISTHVNCSRIDNIASVLSHETGHKEAYAADPIGEHNKPKPVREFPQYIYQIKINPYWEYTTPAFQTGIWNSYYYYGPLYYQLK